MKPANPTICYFGIYQPSAPRDKIYLEGLKQAGFEVLSCVDGSPGFLKFFRLARKHSALKGSYDILWVGYLSTMVVPLARLVSRRKIIFNALDSWYDRAVLDRAAHSRFSPKAWLIWLFDFLAFHLSDVVLVESEQQQKFIAKHFFVDPKKLQVIFTGVDEKVFHPDSTIKKADTFTVVFRGLFLPATGVEVVLEAARLMKDEPVKFTIIGWGDPFQTTIKKAIAEEGLANVTLVTWFLKPDELRSTMLSAHVMLGQFGDHERLNRTIQNKNFEALALGMPFITRDSLSNRELLTDGANCFFVPPADGRALADKILVLKNDSALRERIGTGGSELFEKKCTSAFLARRLEVILESVL